MGLAWAVLSPEASERHSRTKADLRYQSKPGFTGVKIVEGMGEDKAAREGGGLKGRK